MDWSELSQLLPVGVVLLTALVVVAIDLYLKPSDRFVLPDWGGRMRHRARAGVENERRRVVFGQSRRWSEDVDSGRRIRD
jgi:hypothetical protein